MDKEELTEQPESSPQVPAFLLFENCDRCGVPAYVKVITAAGNLFFCGHHYAEHESVIVSRQYLVKDERHMLNLRDYRIDVWTQDVKRSGR